VSFFLPSFFRFLPSLDFVPQREPARRAEAHDLSRGLVWPGSNFDDSSAASLLLPGAESASQAAKPSGPTTRPAFFLFFKKGEEAENKEKLQNVLSMFLAASSPIDTSVAVLAARCQNDEWEKLAVSSVCGSGGGPGGSLCTKLSVIAFLHRGPRGRCQREKTATLTAATPQTARSAAVAPS